MTTDFSIGTRYECPATEPAAWFRDVLEQIRAEREGEIPIRLEATTGHQVDGLLGSLDPGISPGPYGKVSIDSHGEDLVIGSEMLKAFTLLPGKTGKRPEPED
ncbi:MAG: hypothetical protein H0X42_01175 [Solirubrobacterales bacterium]|nr:hypothetical protein [Solirubrobacterales bacterium]